MTSMTSFPGNSVIFVQSRASAGRAVAIARGDDCSGRRKDDDDGGFLVVTDWKLTGPPGRSVAVGLCTLVSLVRANSDTSDSVVPKQRHFCTKSRLGRAGDGHRPRR